MNSRVFIETYLRDDITYLKDSFTSTPFKLADIREDKTDPCLDLMLMSSSPGILDGDLYRIEVNIKEKCALRLNTQSYQRVFSMQQSASQIMNVKIEDEGFFQYIPHPTVPHKDAAFKGVNNIYLNNSSGLIWGDLLTCGRKLNGEEFEYQCFDNKTIVYKENLPVIIEHIRYLPKEKSPLVIGHLEGYTHLASLLVLGEFLNVTDMKGFIDNYLADYSQFTSGVSEAPINGLVIKILAGESERLYDVVLSLANRIYTEFFLKYA